MRDRDNVVRMKSREPPSFHSVEILRIFQPHTRFLREIKFLQNNAKKRQKQHYFDKDMTKINLESKSIKFPHCELRSGLVNAAFPVTFTHFGQTKW